MRGIEHLTENQIAGYRAGAFDENASREIGRHLLKCAICRKSLPAPTVEGFWSAVMNEREDDQNEATEKPESSQHSIIFTFPSIFKQFSGLAWTGSALIFVLSVSFLLWLSQARQANQETEVAQNFNAENAGTNSAPIETSERVFPSPIENSRNDDRDFAADSNRPLKPESNKTGSRQNKPNYSSPNDSSQNSAKRVLKNKSESISTTRGGSPAKCGNETPVESGMLLSGKDVILEWEKVPKAAKYTLYVSDEEEILIDEFETVQGTSYVLKKPLDPLKTYKWKIVVTLENGNTVVGDSRKFTLKNLNLGKKKSEKKGKSEIRCSEDKLNR